MSRCLPPPPEKRREKLLSCFWQQYCLDHWSSRRFLVAHYHNAINLRKHLRRQEEQSHACRPSAVDRQSLRVENDRDEDGSIHREKESIFIKKKAEKNAPLLFTHFAPAGVAEIYRPCVVGNMERVSVLKGQRAIDARCSSPKR